MKDSLFDFPTYSINKKIRLIELFGGIGTQAMALRDLGADFESYKLVEIDKYAIQVYNAIHNTDYKPIDIKDVKGVDLGTEREREKYLYLLTYSFPCTDLSVAGKMGGMSKDDWQNGNATRSGLLWEVERILNEIPDQALPNVLVMENVPQVHADANAIDFDHWLKYLRGRGYFNFYQDINSKDFGIPQNRDRCFCVSILSEEFIDFEFPEPVKLEKVMREYLEESVDEKYYVNTEKTKNLITDLQKDGTLETLETAGGGQTVILKNKGTQFEKKTDVATCLMARDYKGYGNQCGNGVIELWL